MPLLDKETAPQEATIYTELRTIFEEKKFFQGRLQGNKGIAALERTYGKDEVLWTARYVTTKQSINHSLSFQPTWDTFAGGYFRWRDEAFRDAWEYAWHDKDFVPAMRSCLFVDYVDFVRDVYPWFLKSVGTAVGDASVFRYCMYPTSQLLAFWDGIREARKELRTPVGFFRSSEFAELAIRNTNGTFGPDKVLQHVRNWQFYNLQPRLLGEFNRDWLGWKVHAGS